MRQFLITKFACATCGELLSLSYEKPGQGGLKYAEGEPTGAAMVEKIVYVVPCQPCAQQLEEMRQAVQTLLKI